MYGLRGERRLTEWRGAWLPGYEGSTPVRIGNAAHEQFQLDVYGEVMDALHQARKGGLAGTRRAGTCNAHCSSFLETDWQEPDKASGRCAGRSGISPIRRSMAWVGFDRAIKAVERYG